MYALREPDTSWIEADNIVIFAYLERRDLRVP